MLGSISPVGEASRNQRWWLTVTAYAVASTAAAAVVGVVLGAAGEALAGAVPVGPTSRLLTLGMVLAFAAVVDAAGRGLPSWHRQVDERWLTTYRGWVYGAGFGAQLGLGVVTIVVSAATYAMLGAAFLSASWRDGMVIGAVFGAARSMPLLLLAGVRSTGGLYTVTRRVAEAEPRMHHLAVAGQGTLAVAALVAAVAA
jgi:hypothetical protein